MQNEETGTCENCKKEFPAKSLLIHIAKRKDCKAYYGIRYNVMKEENQKEWKTRSRSKIGKDEVNRQQRQDYHEGNKGKKQVYYQQNRESLKKISRERAQSKRNDSNANQAVFENDIKFGPEFICICCHGGFFEKEVYDLTEKKEESNQT